MSFLFFRTIGNMIRLDLERTRSYHMEEAINLARERDKLIETAIELAEQRAKLRDDIIALSCEDPRFLPTLQDVLDQLGL